MCGAMADEPSDGDICGVLVHVGDTYQSTSESRTGWFSNQSSGKDMKSWDGISEAAPPIFERDRCC